MKKARSAAVLLFLCAAGLWAQDAENLLKSYTRNFAIASIDIKIQIIRDAGSTGSTELGPLYLQAVDYVLNNYSVIETDQRFRQLAVSALEQLRRSTYREARHSVWKLFDMDTETGVRVACLDALAVLAREDPETIRYINLWMDAQNTIFQTGKMPDVYVVAACVRALGELGDPSSFGVLFRTMSRGYTDQVAAAAREALFEIRGDVKAGLLAVVRDGALEEKQQALEMALSYDRLSDADKGQIAELALDIGLHSATADNAAKAAARKMRYAAADALSRLHWSAASALAIEHFDGALLEYDRGLVDLNQLLGAIELLGNMGTHEAAVRLTQHLMLINSYTERLQEYDGRVVLAVIQNLGKLGDKAAFDDLMYAQYLTYSPQIKKAIQSALEKLKW